MVGGTVPDTHQVEYGVWVSLKHAIGGRYVAFVHLISAGGNVHDQELAVVLGLYSRPDITLVDIPTAPDGLFLRKTVALHAPNRTRAQPANGYKEDHI